MRVNFVEQDKSTGNITLSMRTSIDNITTFLPHFPKRSAIVDWVQDRYIEAYDATDIVFGDSNTREANEWLVRVSEDLQKLNKAAFYQGKEKGISEDQLRPLLQLSINQTVEITTSLVNWDEVTTKMLYNKNERLQRLAFKCRVALYPFGLQILQIGGSSWKTVLALKNLRI